MHERAERIGARLKVRSRPAAGTEVELSIPGNVAFKTQSAVGSPGWFAMLYQMKAEQGELKRPGSEEDE
jgi:hypothetical protein